MTHQFLGALARVGTLTHVVILPVMWCSCPCRCRVDASARVSASARMGTSAHVVLLVDSPSEGQY